MLYVRRANGSHEETPGRKLAIRPPRRKGRTRAGGARTGRTSSPVSNMTNAGIPSRISHRCGLPRDPPAPLVAYGGAAPVSPHPSWPTRCPACLMPWTGCRGPRRFERGLVQVYCRAPML